MTRKHDPFEILRELNPIDEESLGNPADSPEAQAALERILNEKRELWLSWVVRRYRQPLALLVVIACGAIGATAWALSRQGEATTMVGCYWQPSLTARTTIVSLDGSPTSTCARAWRDGKVHGKVPTRLEACSTETGAIGVFPRVGMADVCSKLHLTPLVRQTQSDPKLGEALQEQLSSVFVAQRCMSEGEARAAIRNVLHRLDLDDWRVEVGQAFTSQRPCASAAVDEDSSAVTIVPIPKP